MRAKQIAQSAIASALAALFSFQHADRVLLSAAGGRRVHASGPRAPAGASVDAFGPLVAVLSAAFTRCGEVECEVYGQADPALFWCLRRVGLRATAAAFRCAQLSGAGGSVLSLILSKHDPEEITSHLISLDVGSPEEVRALLSSVHCFPPDRRESSGDDLLDAVDFEYDEYDAW